MKAKLPKCHSIQMPKKLRSTIQQKGHSSGPLVQEQWEKKGNNNRKERRSCIFHTLIPILTPKEMYAPNTLPAMVANPAVIIAWSSDLVMYGK